MIQWSEPLNTVFVHKAGISSTAIGDELVLLNPMTGMYHCLSPVAADIWGRLVPGTSVGAVCLALRQEYDAAASLIEHDVTQLVRELLKHQLLEMSRC